MLIRILWKQSTVVASHTRYDSGSVVIMFLLCLIPLVGFLGMAVDYGNAFNHWRSIQFATDAAALDAARIMLIPGENQSTARTGATQIAVKNGLKSGIDFYPDSSIEFGTWSKPDGGLNGSFTAGGGTGINAVRVSAQRSVNTRFAKVIGLDFFSPSVSSIAFFDTVGTPMCVSPFGLEAANFPDELQIGFVPLNHTFNTPYTLSVGKNSPGNWGKIDTPNNEGEPINMSSNPNFCNAMLQEDCWLPADDEFDPCGVPLSFGDNQLGEEYDGATGGAGVKPVFEALVGDEIVMLVNSAFGNGKKPVDVYGYAIGTVNKVSGSGANMDIEISISELRVDVPFGEEIGGGTTTRHLVK